MPKKVLIFSTAYYPFASGAEMAVKEITDRINDIEFDLITAKFSWKLPYFEKIGNANIYRVGFGIGTFDKFLLPFLGYFKAIKLDKKNNYQIIWSLMASQASIVASFLKIKFPAKKLILTLQEGDEEEYLKRYVFGFDFLYRLLIKPWHILVFKKADKIIAISNDLKTRALKNKAKCEILIIPNGVDINNFLRDFSEKELDKIRDELKICKDDNIIIHTGRLVFKNALNDVITALQYLPKNVKFLMLGVGSDFEKLRNLAKDLKVEDRVIFWEFVSHEDLVKFLKISCIFCRPSLSEGLGSSFLEAMAAGVPVIATPVGGIPDFLKNMETGLFCEVNNSRSIAEKVKIYLENDELRNKIIANAREMIIKNYDWNLIAEKMREIFEKSI